MWREKWAGNMDSVFIKKLLVGIMDLDEVGFGKNEK
jgi:hypothetical protein